MPSIISSLCLGLVMVFEPVEPTEIQLDGNIRKNEWKGAKEFTDANGYKVLLKQEDDLLYIAMRGPDKFWAHVYLWDGDEIVVMHASAALGAIRYQKEGEYWTTQDEFKYEFRNKTFDAESRSIMSGYFDEHRWVANNMNMGDGKSLEMKVRINTNHNIRLAFVMANFDQTLHPFPAEVNDDSVLIELVRGKAVEKVRFSPETWIQL